MSTAQRIAKISSTPGLVGLIAILVWGDPIWAFSQVLYWILIAAIVIAAISNHSLGHDIIHEARRDHRKRIAAGSEQ